MAYSGSTCRYGNRAPSVSFSGSGFMATYQLGVTQCFLTYVPWLLKTSPYILGASAGSLVAAAIVCEVSPILIRDELICQAKEIRKSPLGPFSPSSNMFHWLRRVLTKYLPANAHTLANGRLAVAMTCLSNGKHVVNTEYQSKHDVFQALLCSCFVPGYCGLQPPTFRGEYYIDGGFSSMQPFPPSPCGRDTLTVSPFSGDTDICPEDSSSLWDMVVSGSTLKGNRANSVRVVNALYPLALEILEQAFDRGYKDTIDFLLRNDLAPISLLNSVPHDPLHWSSDEMRTNQGIRKEDEGDEEEVAKENETLASLEDNTLETIVDDVFYRKQKQTLQQIFWTFICLGHFLFFFFNIFVQSFRKSAEQRFSTVALLLKGFKSQTGPRLQRKPTASS